MRYPPPARRALHALRVACLNFRTRWEVTCLRASHAQPLRASCGRACAGWRSVRTARYLACEAALLARSKQARGVGSPPARACAKQRGAQAAAWAVRKPHKLVGLQLMQPHRFTQPKQNGWSLHGRDAAAVQLMGCLLQCIQCGSSHQADASHGGNLLARRRCF